jgi:hypothetical protein
VPKTYELFAYVNMCVCDRVHVCVCALVHVYACCMCIHAHVRVCIFHIFLCGCPRTFLSVRVRELLTFERWMIAREFSFMVGWKCEFEVCKSIRRIKYSARNNEWCEIPICLDCAWFTNSSMSSFSTWNVSSSAASCAALLQRAFRRLLAFSAKRSCTSKCCSQPRRRLTARASLWALMLGWKVRSGSPRTCKEVTISVLWSHGLVFYIKQDL